MNSSEWMWKRATGRGMTRLPSSPSPRPSECVTLTVKGKSKENRRNHDIFIFGILYRLRDSFLSFPFGVFFFCIFFRKIKGLIGALTANFVKALLRVSPVRPVTVRFWTLCWASENSRHAPKPPAQLMVPHTMPKKIGGMIC
jgi:hypothetical protein